MTIRYSPDTCGCVVYLENGTLKFIDWDKKCPGHASFDGEQLMTEIRKQCLKFQISKADQKDKKKINENMVAKMKEKRKILKSGKVIVNKKLIRNSIL